MSGLDRLTQREQEVLRCIHSALTNPEIAKVLGIHIETVKRHITNIYDKVGCSSKVELVAMTIGGDCIRAYRCDGCSELLELGDQGQAPSHMVVSVNDASIFDLPRICPRCVEHMKMHIGKLINARVAV